MVLGWSFSLYGLLLVLTLVPFFIYRKRIKALLIKDDSFNDFIIEIKEYLKINHPRITFDYSIIKKTETEGNIKTREILVLENLVSQFTEYPSNLPNSCGTVDSSLLWDGYDTNSTPIIQKNKTSKLPFDWGRRRELSWKRENNRCQRCSIELKLDDVQITFLKSVKDGGKYNFENLVVFCPDCYKITSSEDLEKTKKGLNILDNLLSKVNID